MPHHILIVEDDSALRELYGIYLKRAQFTCTLVTNGHEALDVLQDVTIHLMLVDVNLGDAMSGIELIEQVRQKDYSAMPKIIVLTSFPERFDEDLKPKVSAFLNKPITYNDLLHAVQSALLEDIDPL